MRADVDECGAGVVALLEGERCGHTGSNSRGRSKSDADRGLMWMALTTLPLLSVSDPTPPDTNDLCSSLARAPPLRYLTYCEKPPTAMRDRYDIITAGVLGLAIPCMLPPLVLLKFIPGPWPVVFDHHRMASPRPARSEALSFANASFVEDWPTDARSAARHCFIPS